MNIHRKLAHEEIVAIILAYITYMSLFMAVRALIAYWFWIAMLFLVGIVLVTIAFIVMSFRLRDKKKGKVRTRLSRLKVIQNNEEIILYKTNLEEFADDIFITKVGQRTLKKLGIAIGYEKLKTNSRAR